MNFQQKAAALKALSEISVRIRGENNWYVNQNVEVKAGGMLEGRYGNGETPESAIEDHWRALVEDLKPEEYLVIHAYGGKRRAVKWNGFMWEDTLEEK